MEPQVRLGLATLTKMAFDGIDLGPVRAELLDLCFQQENPAWAMMDLSVIYQIEGDQDLGLAWQDRALGAHRAFSTHHKESGQTKVLVCATPRHMGGNTPIEFLLSGSDMEIITYYPDFENDTALPDHDVAFCAIPADGDGAQDYYDKLHNLMAFSGTKVLNLPATSVDVDRDGLEEVFSRARGLRLPKTMRISRMVLDEALEDGNEQDALSSVGSYPYVIRPVGSHAGRGLAKVYSSDELRAYLDGCDDPAFFVSEFINYASDDGNFRKYRIVFVDGKAFPVHMAVSDQWDLWYMNAKMDQFPERRAQEERFMDRFDEDFAKRHRRAFNALTKGIDLDYFGIDCAEDENGKLVLFEADNALIVHDMDPQDLYPYKSRHMQRIFRAFEGMLLGNCASTRTPVMGPIAEAIL